MTLIVLAVALVALLAGVLNRDTWLLIVGLVLLLVAAYLDGRLAA